jgi:hypothetical protein
MIELIIENAMNDLLRNIPSVTELLDSPAIKDLLISTPNGLVV